MAQPIDIAQELQEWKIPPLNLTQNFWAVTAAMMEGFPVLSLEGGARSGKTYAILQWIVLASLSPKTFMPDFPDNRLVTRCLRLEAINARDSCFQDINDILLSMGIKDGERGFKCNTTMQTWKFPNGSEITFGGAADTSKLHGLSQDIVFFNEVMFIPKKAFEQADMRTRRAIILDWNPLYNQHWVFDMKLDRVAYYTMKDGATLAGKPRCCYFHSTYKDNFDTATGKPNLTERQIRRIESYEPTPENIEEGTADRYLWDVYGLGKRGVLEGRIVPLEKIILIEDDSFPSRDQCKGDWGYGLDWGFSDPTVLVQCCLFNKMLYVRELIYEKELVLQAPETDPDQDCVISRLKKLGIKPDDIIVADNARKDLNIALRANGYNVVGADKIAGSIMNGINLMNSRRWCVTENSFNIRKELENYVWKQTRNGERLNTPVDKWNHAMDAIRYWLTTFLSSANQPISASNETKDGETIEYGCAIEDYFV